MNKLIASRLAAFSIAGALFASAATPLLARAAGASDASDAATDAAKPATARADAKIFDYDRKAPLDLKEASARAENGVTIHDVSYASPKGGRVPAYVVVPEGKGKFAGIVAMHGAPGNRDNVLKRSIALARTGAVVVAITGPFSRGRSQEDMFDFGERDRADQIQLIVDLRRAIDLLAARPDVDTKRMAYVGGSYGGAMGGLLAGVEKRLKAYVLVVGDGGLVAHMRADGARGPLGQLTEAQRDRWFALMEPIEPIRFVGDAAPAALFFQSGRQDQFVPVASSEAYHAAGSEPKLVKWYDAGHALDDQARTDQVTWLAGQIGIDAAKFAIVR